ncbi:MAG: Aspartyl/glutamyl-tRNA(Asn/Gln) amidotransferase subunit C [Candidatus Roizmanbacteria bacterium GW2011_GWB1_40_7]|uniref:Aspartyl/glutamyl-tRNA(Asn/Gln) amidotransferase subunit C n=1 Tax=Candidatus Roizmanbacteria bacterium GW2011_GWB1_40_7 TaxID=1618482 RepID=A0A0G0TBP2_9BACT|nr:MAG: Aspartyl/glutamyl-tRNA(Asn/Gln) amidotransferase subunit C [Candidatus Roizmanbacteria bacterium GW2011_GWB1_40_7]HLD25059.1 Asp-tRNA(Asn)/Glu-tRNA(Gln) amidotransferase subunit GatC [Patescibacteria group bacterium]
MKGSTFSSSDVVKIAKLANIPVSNDQADELARGFTKTMTVVDELTRVDVAGVEATNQVTGLENVLREDEIDTSRMFTAEQALAGAKRTHNGFFIVDQILEEKV